MIFKLKPTLIEVGSKIFRTIFALKEAVLDFLSVFFEGKESNEDIKIIVFNY